MFLPVKNIRNENLRLAVLFNFDGFSIGFMPLLVSHLIQLMPADSDLTLRL